MSFIITPGVNGGFPYIGGMSVPEKTPVLVQPYPKSIFCTNGGALPVLLPAGQTRLTISEMYSADKPVNELYFGENEVQAAFINGEELFRVEWF